MKTQQNLKNSVLSAILILGSLMTILGCNETETAQSSDNNTAEIDTNTQQPPSYQSSEMNYPRANHQAVKLNDGKVFVFGGIYDSMINPKLTEIYDPADNSWSAGPDLVNDRSFGHGVLLPDGNVLIAGGSSLAIEIFNPVDNTIVQVGSFAHSRNGASFTLLKNGDVLVAGGATGVSPFPFFDDAEIFDYRNNSLRPTFRSMGFARAGHSAVLMSSGDVLIFGGVNRSNLVQATLVFNHGSEGFYSTNSLREMRFDLLSFSLPSGEILAVGGSKFVNGSVEVINSAESFGSYGAFDFDPNLPHGFFGAAGAQLSDGTPLVTGGDNFSNDFGNDSIYLYDLAQKKFILVGQMNQARKQHTLTVLDDGSALVTGGWGRIGNLKSAERFVPNSAGVVLQ